MHQRILRTVTAVAAAAALSVGSVAASTPVNAAPVRAHITAHPSDTTVDSGEQFVVRGRFTLDGHAVGNRTVKIQTLLRGSWQPITGARVQTNSDGTYRVRVILFTDGDRTLRAVGESPGRIRNAYKRFYVHVR